MVTRNEIFIALLLGLKHLLIRARAGTSPEEKAFLNVLSAIPLTRNQLSAIIVIKTNSMRSKTRSDEAKREV